MNLISWNCRGLGNLRTIWELCRIVKQKKPALVFLMETKLRSDKMKLIHFKMGFPNMFVVDFIRRSGGMTLMWDEDINLDIQNYSQCHINGMVKMRMSREQWKFTGFYGHPDPSKRHEAWTFLKYIATLSLLPWVCLRDFNEILTSTEKWGGRERLDS